MPAEGIPHGFLAPVREGGKVINKDYILRLAERIGRELSIVLGLRKRESAEESLIAIDDLLTQSTGFSSRFLNTLSEETLLQLLSPLGQLNVESGLWIASLLYAEGTFHEEKGNNTESYYRYLKALTLLLAVLKSDPIDRQEPFATIIQDLLQKLDAYQLPAPLQHQLFWYYERQGAYAQAENILFELLEDQPGNASLRSQGQAFYNRLLAKEDSDLQAGNLTRAELREGLAQLS